MLAASGIGIWMLTQSPAPIPVIQVDASPSAMVTVRSERGELFPQQATPFTLPLGPGRYFFEFESAGRTETREVIVADASQLVRVDFWDTNQTRSLLEAYK